jgi:deoxycytidylate deaminase
MLENIGKCAKQEVIAILETHGMYFVGTNVCGNVQKECPRKDMPTGWGYEKCHDICQQPFHAEVVALIQAGRQLAKDGTLYLIGHTYCCDDCKKQLEEYGVTNIIIGKLPEAFTNKIKKEND